VALPTVQEKSTDSPLISQKLSRLHPSLDLMLRIVSEGWHAMDAVVPLLWPGWDSYKDNEVFFGGPKTGDILINFQSTPPKRFKKLDRTVHEKVVYYSLHSYVEKNRGGGTLIMNDKKYKLVRLGVKTTEKDIRYMNYNRRILNTKDLPDFIEQLIKSLEYNLSVIAHESFHMYQLQMVGKRRMANVNVSLDAYLDLDQAARICLEAAIIDKALYASKNEERLALIKKFLAVRNKRRRSLEPEHVEWEQRNEWVEGTAQYIQMRIILLLDELNYTPRVLRPDDNNFHSFRLSEEVRKTNRATVLGSARCLELPDRRAYYLGSSLCFLLDEITGNEWKSRYFHENVYLDDLLTDASGFDKKMSEILDAEARKEFNFDILKKEMKELIQMFDDRK
jgi:hypothetical protein